MGQVDLIARHTRRLCEQEFSKPPLSRSEEHLLEFPQHFGQAHNGVLISMRTHFDICTENFPHGLCIRDKELRILGRINSDVVRIGSQKGRTCKKGNISVTQKVERELAPLLREDVDAQRTGYDMQRSRAFKRAAMNRRPLFIADETRIRDQLIPLRSSKPIPEIKLIDIIPKITVFRNMRLHIRPPFFLLSQ